MSSFLVGLLTMVAIISSTASAATYTASVSGDWNSATTWGGAGIPGATGAGDIVQINPGITVTVTAAPNYSVASITFLETSQATSALMIDGGFTITVTGAVTLNSAADNNTACAISGGGTLACGSVVVGSNVTPGASCTTTMTSTLTTFNISGNLTLSSSYHGHARLSYANNPAFLHTGGIVTVNGSVTTANTNSNNVATYTMGNSSPTLVLGGATTFSTSGTGTSNITLNGTGATVIYSHAGAQAVYGTSYYNLTFSGSGTKTLQTGTTTVSGDLTLSGTATTTTVAGLTVSGNLIIGDGTTFTAAGYNLTVADTLFVGGGTSGSLVVNSTGGIKTFGVVVINSGGTWNSTQAETYGIGGDIDVNGGTITGSATGIFNVGGNFNVNSGTSTLGQSTITVTGVTTLNGTLNISSATGAKTFVGLVTVNTGAAWNNSSNSGITFEGGITNNGTFTTGSGTQTFSTNAQSLSGTLSIPNVTVTGITLTNNGTMTASTALSGTGDLAQAANATLNIGGTSGITTLTATASGNTVNYNGASQTVHLNDYYNLTFSGSGTKTLQTGTTSISGNWTNNGVTTSPGSSTVNFNASVAQTIGGSSTSTFHNLTMNNSSGVTLNEPVSVDGTLTLTSGTVTTSPANLLTITNTSTGSIAGASSASYINGPIALTLTAGVAGDGTTYTFPVGETGNYRPLALVNIRTTSGTSPVVEVTESPTGALTGDGTTITSIAPRNWYVQTSGGTLTSATIQLTESGLIPTNVVGQSTAQPGNYASIGGTNIGATITSVLTATSFPIYFAIGISSVMGLYSYQSGNWDSLSTWTTDPSGRLWSNPRVPSASGTDNVTILNGRTISITSNSKNITSLTLNAGGVLVLNATAGHNFGAVTGQGKMILSSNNFPGGTFTNFVSSGGGTIEYYNLNNIPITTTQFTYNNLIISDSTGNHTTYMINPSNPTTYTVNGDFSFKNYVSGGDTLYFGNPTTPSDNLINMAVYGNFSVDAGCYIKTANFATAHPIPNPSDEGTTSYPVHTLNLYGNLTNNGSIRFTGLPSPAINTYDTLSTTAYNGTKYGDVQVFFYGATNNTVACNGTTDFFRFIEAKGADKTYTLEVTSTSTNNFALYAPNNQGNNVFAGGTVNGYGYGVYYKALFIHYGTLKLDANINVPSITEGGQDFNLVPTAGLWVNGANVFTTVSGFNGTSYQAATLYGYLRISAGQFSTGDAAGIVLGTLGTPTITVEGTGVLDVSNAWSDNGGTNLMSYVQTGGTADFRLQGESHASPMFALNNPNASFEMSGGTINFTNNTFINSTPDHQIMDIEVQSGYYHVTGGTININVPGSDTSYTVVSVAPMYNLNISRGTSTKNVIVQWNAPSPHLEVLNNLTVNGNTILDLSTNPLSLYVGGNFTIASGGTYMPGAADTTVFEGGSYQAFVNTGTISGGALNNLSIINTSLTTIISNDLTVNGTITIMPSCVLNDSGRYVYANGNIVNAGSHTGLSSGGGIRLTGTGAQAISGGGRFYNLIIDKPNSTGVSLSANMTVKGALRLLRNPNLNIGSYNLTLDSLANIYTDLSTGASFDSLHMIVTAGLPSDNGVTKTFCSASTSFLFPIGTGTKYRPAKIQFTSSPVQYGSITVRPVPSADPMVQVPGDAINFYWKVTSSNFSGIQSNSINQIYYYSTADAPNPSDENNYIPAVFISPGWTTINDTSFVVDYKTPREIHFNSVSYIDGRYTCGLLAAFGSVATLYSIASGFWSSASTWSTTRGGSAGSTVPDSTTVVFMTGGTTVSTTSAASAGDLTIEPGATLDLGSVVGHNFGTVYNNTSTGSGKLRIASSGYFPKGDWGGFIGANGGTVEYYQTGTGTLNLPTSYTLPNGNTADITGYCSLITSPYSGGNINLPNTNLTVYGNFTVGYSSGGGTGNCTTQFDTTTAMKTLEVKGVVSINQYGILQFQNSAAQNVVADSDLAIAAGGTLQVRSGGTTNLANSLTVEGNVINNGTLDLDPDYPTNDNYHCSLGFSGAYSKSLKSTARPTRTRLYSIIVNKGSTLDSVVNVSIDTAGFQMGGGGLSLQNGTFRLTSKVTIALSTGAFTVPVTGGLSANGGTLNVVTDGVSANLVLKGRLEVLSGAVNVGPPVSSSSSISAAILYSAAGSPTIFISGGSLNVYSQVRRDTANNSGSLNYTQTGGTVTIGGKNPSAARGAFEVLNTGSSFTMSGGTMIIATGGVNTISPFDMDIEPAASNVTGGTIQLGLSGVTTVSTTFRFEASVPLWNLTLEPSSNSSAIQEIYSSTISGNLVIGGTSSFYNANGLDLVIGGNLTNNNTSSSTGTTVGGFRPQSLTQTTSFIGTDDQTITGTASNRTNFANLMIATVSSHTTNLSAGTCTVTVNGNLTLSSGTLNDGGNSINLLGNVNNSAVHVSANATAGGIIFSGTSNQVVSGSGNGVLGNIEINNGGHGINTTANLRINGRIKFTNGFIYINDYALTLGPSVSIAGTVNASNLIKLNGVVSDKGVTKFFPSGTSSFTFPVGANGKYTPAEYSFSSNNNNGGTISVIPVDQLHPSVNPDSVTAYLKYYWYVSATGFSSSYSVTHTYTYVTGDTVGTPAHIQRFDNVTSTWDTVSGTITPTTFSFTSTSLLDGSYTIGTGFTALPLLYSIMSGSWFNSSLWTTDTTTKVPYGKAPSGNPVIILRGDSVALSSNGANAASVVIYGVLDAENTTQHNLGQVSGNGKVMISSTADGFFAFPGGTFDTFMANPASTVEYYGSVSGRLPLDPGNTTKPYQNVIFAGNSKKYISSVATQVNGNMVIETGSTLDNTQYNENVYILGNWIDDNADGSGFTPGTGTVFFNDMTGTQSIDMQTDTSTETFYNLCIQNASGVTFTSGNAVVSHQLILTSGNITTNSNHNLTITNTDSSAVVGGGVGSFINGPLKKLIPNGSAFQFPVGDAVSSSRNRFGYIKVSNTSTSGTQSWTVQFLDKNPSSDGYATSNVIAPLKSVVYNEYWKISGPAGGTANVTLSWDGYTGMSSLPSTRALSKVAEWSTPVAGNWNSAGGIVSDFGQDSGKVKTTSPLGLAGTNVLTIGTAAIAALITAIQTGLWNNPGIWDVGRVPASYDSVIISSPCSVVLDTASTISRLVLDSGATYNDSTFTLSVNGKITLNGTWTGSGKMSMIGLVDTICGTGSATGNSTLEIAGSNETVSSTAHLTLNTVSILSGNTLNNNGYLSIDTLKGAAATSVFNNLPGSQLTVSGPLLTTGTFDAGTCSNTVIYNGSAAQVIKPATYCTVVVGGSGAKTVSGGASVAVDESMEILAGPVLTLQTGASVTTPGSAKIIIDPGANYINLSSSAPMLQVETRFTGSDGWRMVAAPNNVTVGSMFASPFVTQGFTGSRYPALQPNLMWWDETSQGTSLQAWRDPASTSDAVKLGRGYMYYVFNGAQLADSSGNYSDALPLTMTAAGVEHPLTTAFDFGVTATTRTPGSPTDTVYTDTNYVDYGWNMVGNPTPSTIDWDAPSGWTKTNMDQTIYVWDPNDTAGGYKTWNGVTGNLGSGRVAPFQAFWVKANAANPQLTCTNDVKTSGGSFLEAAGKAPSAGPASVEVIHEKGETNCLVKKNPDKPGSGLSENNPETPGPGLSESDTSRPTVLTLTLSANGIQTKAYLMFSDQGKLTYNPYDAFSLVSPSSNYLILYSVAGQGQPAMQIQDLPDTGYSEPATLQLYVGGTVSGKPLDGTFTLNWKLEGKPPSGHKILLMDDAAGKADTMTDAGQLTFEYNTPGALITSFGTGLAKTSCVSPGARSITAIPRPVVQSVPLQKTSGSSAAPRFRMVICSNEHLEGYLPTTPVLQQNYPNPFNPTTNIAFSVPSMCRVTIDIYDILGQRVTTLTDRDYSTGNYVITWNPVRCASGVYFCRMITGNHKQAIKMMLLR